MTRARHVLGFDPGFRSFGWGAMYLGRASNFDDVVDVGVIHTEKNDDARAVDDNVARTRIVAENLRSLVHRFEPVVLCAEAFSPPRNASAAAKVALAWGVLIDIAVDYSIPLLQVGPQDIKIALTKNRSASKIAVEKVVRRLYPSMRNFRAESSEDHEHVFDAIGAAHACLEHDVVRTARDAR